jgi:drug/metabolite transporter (DMT)-like permease
MPAAGVIFCLASAVAFGAMGIFGKLAYEEGATVGVVLAARFTFAAVLFWLAVATIDRARSLRALTRRDVALGIALGAVGYAGQAGAYFLGLTRIDVSLLSLLVYTYPVFVTVAAIVIGRESASRRTAVALLLASGGLALVLGGAAAGKLDTIGTLLGLGAALVYSTYILVSDGVAGRVGPITLSTLVCTGCAVTLTSASIASGDFTPGDVSAEGWLWLVSVAVVSTVAAIGFFFAGLRRVGPSAASILSTVEPVTTVALAFAIFGESMTAVQLMGGALVIAAVVTVRVRHEEVPA